MLRTPQQVVPSDAGVKVDFSLPPPSAPKRILTVTKVTTRINIGLSCDFTVTFYGHIICHSHIWAGRGPLDAPLWPFGGRRPSGKRTFLTTDAEDPPSPTPARQVGTDGGNCFATTEHKGSKEGRCLTADYAEHADAAGEKAGPSGGSDGKIMGVKS